MKKEKQKITLNSIIRFLERIFFKYVLKIFLYCLILVFFFIVDFYDIDLLFSNIKTSYSFEDIIISFLPLIVTITTLGLSLSNDTFYKVDRREFEQIRRRCCFTFSFLEFIILTIISFILFAIFSYFEMIKMQIALNIVVIIISFLFAFQEIPLLSKRKWMIKHILRCYYYRSIHQDGEFGYHPNTEELFKKVILNLSLDNGYKESFKYLRFYFKKERNNEIDFYIFNIMYNHFLDISNNIEGFISLSDLNITMESSIIKEIESYLDSVNFLLDTTNFLYKDDEKYNLNYIVRETIFSISEIVKKFNLKKDFLKAFNPILTNIFSKYYYKDEDDKEHYDVRCYKFIVSLMMEATINKNFTILNVLRDFKDELILDESNINFYLFLLIYTEFIELATTSDDTNVANTELTDFIKEEHVGRLNKDKSLENKINDALILNTDLFINTIDQILDIYNLFTQKDYDDLFRYCNFIYYDESYDFECYFPIIIVLELYYYLVINSYDEDGNQIYLLNLLNENNKYKDKLKKVLKSYLDDKNEKTYNIFMKNPVNEAFHFEFNVNGSTIDDKFKEVLYNYLNEKEES